MKQKTASQYILILIFFAPKILSEKSCQNSIAEVCNMSHRQLCLQRIFA